MKTQELKIVHTVDAPAAIGPYSQAVEANGMLFISGQIAINPQSGLMDMDSISAETHRVMKNLSAILIAANTNFNQVVKTTIFLSSMDHFQEVNEVYASYFEATYPARETVAVLGLPKGVNVEISMIVVK